MKAKPQMSLAEMAAKAAGTVRQDGRLSCPRCGCTDLKVDKTKTPVSATFRNRQCRHCGAQFRTVQPPEAYIEDIEPRKKPSLQQEYGLDDDIV